MGGLIDWSPPKELMAEAIAGKHCEQYGKAAYITRINRVIREVADERGLRVAEVSRHFIPPWAGKFSVDNFHPSQDGYRDWSRALVEALTPAQAAIAAA